jgi:aldehyde:ferredoxin oxidoreductase
VDAGIDIVQVSAGNDATPEWICQPMFMEKACLVDSAERIKKALDIPVMAVGRINDPLIANEIIGKGKADLVYKSENLGMLTNACVICQFNFYALSVTDLVDMMRFATGFDYDLDELVACGERIWMLKRGLNNLMGVTAADDRLPKRMMTPFKEGGAAGSLPDMEKMLKEYYSLRGLDAQGRPLKERLNALGLTELAEKLY